MRLAVALVLGLCVACDGPGVDDGGGRDAASPGDAGRVSDAGDPDRDAGPASDAGPPRPPADGLPVGVPTPSFGYRYDTGGPATLFVDNTHPGCDDTRGTEAAPLCDLFRGGRSATFEAGQVVHILGGPYLVDGDYTLTFNGERDRPVVLLGVGADRVRFDGEGARVDVDYQGRYAVVENLEFYNRTRHVIDGEFLVLRDVGVLNPVGALIDWNPVVSVRGHDLLIYESEIGNNRRADDTDSHGINAGAGSFNLWILDNEIYNNNGDSFQGCHRCFADPPHHVYIGRNVMHDDRENAVDLKTIADVVVSENVMYGYGSSATSGGDAIVIGSNGFDDATNMGPRRVWVINNELRDSSTGVRAEGSEDVWILGNVITDVNTGFQIDNKPHRRIVFAANTLRGVVTDGVSVFGCRPSELVVANNAFVSVGERQLDMRDCFSAQVSVSNNLFWTSLAARIDGGAFSDVSALDASAFAERNLVADPMFEAGTLVPSAGSPLVDAGGSLMTHYDAFTGAFGPTIAVDRAGTPRGAIDVDIGAFERP